MSADKRKALFICLGNICRSPIAEGVFQKTVNDLNLGEQWEIDSAAIGGWHVGNPPDWRALDTMKKHNVPYNNHARQENMRDLKRKAPKGSTAKLLLFGDYDPEGDRIIRDPYYDSDSKGFEKCYQQSVRCSKGFLEHLENKVTNNQQS
ncbi:Primo-1 [Operophtera brumata]|uniref:Primo-1 n=1 Tax=Operophtera brumata TaxID=104452 RepID=A0A0L7KQI4_OPEBR|nr:Primo-1 [Operophtera brumata]